MATYKPYRKTDKAGTLEEIKIPYSSVDGTPTIPTKTSQLTNDSGFITSAPANYTTSSRSPSQCTANGFYYVSSSVNSLTDANGNPFLQYHTSNNDFRILATAYSDSWVQQIATDFRSTHIYYRIRNNGTWGAWTEIAKISDIPTVNNGTLTIQKNGTNVQTFSANQSGNATANITVPTKASDVNALSLDGGTINKSKTIKMDASANSDGANLKWGTVNHKNPYIGYASDQVDGTFVVGSLLGTNYASGLAIGGGSGNLLWKGTKVATTSDIPTVNNGTLTIQKNGTTVATFSANQSGNATANITVPTKVSELTNDSGYTANKGTVTQVKINGTTTIPNSEGLVDLGTISGGGTTSMPTPIQVATYEFTEESANSCFISLAPLSTGWYLFVLKDLADDTSRERQAIIYIDNVINKNKWLFDFYETTNATYIDIEYIYISSTSAKIYGYGDSFSYTDNPASITIYSLNG